MGSFSTILKACSRDADAIGMSGFDSHELPDWVRDQFDSQTALPHGPLQQLPVPLEGRIIGAQSCVPTDHRPPQWKVSVRCAEPLDDTMRFYEEFLPLCGFELVGVGKTHARRAWFNRATPSTGFIVFRVAEFIGHVTIEPDTKGHTRVETVMAHCQHPGVRNLVDREELRKRDDVHWRLNP